MKFIVKCLLIVFGITMFSSCMPTLLEPIVVKYAPIEDYKYIYVKPTQGLQSGSGVVVPIGGRIYGVSETRSVWFMIGNKYGKYYIIMFYDNKYNEANGEDL